MQKGNKNAVLKNNQHSRVSLSGMTVNLNNAPLIRATPTFPLNGGGPSSPWRERVKCVNTGVRGSLCGFPLGRHPELVSGSRRFMKGFTLIELLVVILIIGILAAVALPQYQKAVEKSRSVQALTLLKATYQAAQAYYLANGSWPSSLDQLDISLSDKQKENFVCSSIAQTCNKAEWGVSLYKSVNGLSGIVAWRTSGPYKGGGFAMYHSRGTSGYTENQLYCIERFAGPNARSRSYCNKIFKGKYVSSNNNSYHYLLQ